jgi:transposase-like protein
MITNIPTPRTDAELARVLLDFDLTNIDRREALADFARVLEGELQKLGSDFAAVCRTNSANADAMIAQAKEIRELRRQVQERDEDTAILIDCATNGREFQAYSENLQAALKAVAALRTQLEDCCKKTGYTP